MKIFIIFIVTLLLHTSIGKSQTKNENNVSISNPVINSENGIVYFNIDKTIVTNGEKGKIQRKLYYDSKSRSTIVSNLPIVDFIQLENETIAVGTITSKLVFLKPNITDTDLEEAIEVILDLLVSDKYQELLLNENRLIVNLDNFFPNFGQKDNRDTVFSDTNDLPVYYKFLSRELGNTYSISLESNKDSIFNLEFNKNLSLKGISYNGTAVPLVGNFVSNFTPKIVSNSFSPEISSEVKSISSGPLRLLKLKNYSQLAYQWSGAIHFKDNKILNYRGIFIPENYSLYIGQPNPVIHHPNLGLTYCIHGKEKIYLLKARYIRTNSIKDISLDVRDELETLISKSLNLNGTDTPLQDNLNLSFELAGRGNCYFLDIIDVKNILGDFFQNAILKNSNEQIFTAGWKLNSEFETENGYWFTNSYYDKAVGQIRLGINFNDINNIEFFQKFVRNSSMEALTPSPNITLRRTSTKESLLAIPTPVIISE